MTQMNPKTDLLLERVVHVAPELVWAAWTQPEHLKKWFAPRPWTVSHCEVDLRPGGLCSTTMRSPEGQDFPNIGCYLEIIEHKKLVFTNTLGPDFRPSENPFFTAVITLESHGTGTKYSALAMHKDEASRQQHEEMGFHVGWGMCLDQLVELVTQWKVTT
jgi:uncharacterized protein YndB with AHSA1/START domain